jgi:hypothetical protein
MTPNIIHRNENKTVIGTLNDELYVGTPFQIGFDELQCETVDNGDGTVTKVMRYGDYIHAKSNLNKASTIKTFFDKFYDGTNEEEAKLMAEQMWEENTQNIPNKKVYMQALDVNGDLVEVEKKITIYNWEKVT